MFKEIFICTKVKLFSSFKSNQCLFHIFVFLYFIFGYIFHRWENIFWVTFLKRARSNLCLLWLCHLHRCWGHMVVPYQNRNNNNNKNVVKCQNFSTNKNTKRMINSCILSNSVPNEWMNEKTSKKGILLDDFICFLFLLLLLLHFRFFFSRRKRRQLKKNEMNNLQIIQWNDRDKNRRLCKIGWLPFVHFYTRWMQFVFADGTVSLQPISFSHSPQLQFSCRIYSFFMFVFFFCHLAKLSYPQLIVTKFTEWEKKIATGNRLLFLITKTTKHIHLVWCIYTYLKITIQWFFENGIKFFFTLKILDDGMQEKKRNQ